MQNRQPDSAALSQLYAQYRKLCDYCGDFWKKVASAFPDEIACHKGCGLCCELQSVNALEAAMIARVWQPQKSSAVEQIDTGRCSFLSDEQCCIYDSRPIICRTHGLLLRSESFESPATSCPYNFQKTDYDRISTSLQLDIDLVTTSLGRLNIAFCIINDMQSLSSERFSLAGLHNGTELPFDLPASIEHR